MFSADLGGAAPASAPAATDPPFQKVALLLHGDGTNGAQNNTFVDYSYPGGYAVSFDGSGDYLSASISGGALDFGTGDFTIEGWFNFAATDTHDLIRMYASGNPKYAFYIYVGTQLAFYDDTTGSNPVVNYSFTNNTWYHIAWVRSAGTLKIYINGTSVISNTYTASMVTGIDSVKIGSQSPSRESTACFASNVRVVKGTALYTSNFVPSNQPLTAVSGTSLLTCQSATIVDNSPNAFTIMANGNAAAVSSKTITRTGNVAQGTFSPFSLAEGQWSNYFDGSGDYLTLPANALPQLTSDFTIECWMYCGVTTDTIIASSSTSNNFQIFRINQTVAGSVSVYWNTNTDLFGSSTSYITSNTWNHLALTRVGTTAYLWVNGVQVASKTGVNDNTCRPDTIGSFRLNGTISTAIPQFNGYVSNYRVVNGTAVYTSNFTPSTSGLTAISGTSLLTCQSNRFKDNSSNNFTITPTGDTKVTASSPFAPSAAYSAGTNGGSGYFDGSGDYLSTPSISLAGDFTIECWVNYSGTPQALVNVGDYGQAGGLFLYINSSTRVGAVYSGNASRIQGTTFVAAGGFAHLALVRSSGVAKLYVNGVNEGVSWSTTQTFSGAVLIGVGKYNNALSGYTTGYITNSRIVNGTAVYTSNFTPPTSPLTAISGTSLLLNCTNAGIFDNAIKNDIETVGNAQISTSVKKYGTGSMAFDGTGDWLLLADRPELQLGTGNFTVEGWLYLGATGAARGIVGKGTSTTGWLLSTNSSNQVVFTYASSTITSTGTLSGSTWYHIAVCREGTGSNQTKIYINGTNDGTGTVNTNFNQTSVMYVGANRTGGDAMNGYIDDLRITQGLALYTSNFTPPTQAFPDV